MIEPEHLADRIVHGIDPDDLGVAEKIALAGVYATLAHAREVRTQNLISLLPYADEMHAEGAAILRAVIRRRSRLFPHLPANDHGHVPNGGE